MCRKTQTSPAFKPGTNNFRVFCVVLICPLTHGPTARYYMALFAVSFPLKKSPLDPLYRDYNTQRRFRRQKGGGCPEKNQVPASGGSHPGVSVQKELPGDCRQLLFKCRFTRDPSFTASVFWPYRFSEHPGWLHLLRRYLRS